MTEPTVTDDGFVIVTNTKGRNSGKLVAQSLLTDMSVSVFGDGNGAEYTIQSTIFKPASYDPNDPDYRIEFSPKHPSRTDLLLGIMYVTDADNTDECIRAQEISTDKLAGALILGKAILFAKDRELISSATAIDIPTAESETECYISGLDSREWRITCDGCDLGVYTPNADDGLLIFTTHGGKITITPVL